MKMCTITRSNIRHFIMTIEQQSTRIYRPGEISLQRRRIGPKGVVKQKRW